MMMMMAMMMMIAVWWCNSSVSEPHDGVDRIQPRAREAETRPRVHRATARGAGQSLDVSGQSIS